MFCLLAGLGLVAVLGFSLATGMFRGVTEPVVSLVPQLHAAEESVPQERTEWTDVNGRTANMRLLEVRTEDGHPVGVFAQIGRTEPFSFPLSQLCEEDRAYIAAHMDTLTPTPAPEGVEGAAGSDEPRELTLFESRVRRDLVYWDGERFERLSLMDFKPVDYYLVYFASATCQGSGYFTPRLLSLSSEETKRTGKFEVVFVSRDESERLMRTHTSRFNMPWPMLTYSQTSGRNALTELNKRGTPCLVLLDKDGEVLAHSDSIDNVVTGPARVLVRLEELLAKDT